MKTTITPEMARELLAKNTKNRSISRDSVRKYASDMEKGRWKLNGSSIVVGEDGALMDGQHRLEACIMSGCSFETILVTDVTEEARGTIDGGRKRLAGDVLSIQGVHQGTAVAATARVVLNYLGTFNIAAKVSTPAILELVDWHPDIIDFAPLARKSRVIIPPGPLGAVLFLGTRARGAGDLMKRAVAFADGVASGADLRNDDPRLALRTAFIQYRARTRGGQAPLLGWSFPQIVTAWNHWVKQQPVGRIIVVAKGNKAPVPNVVGGPPRGAGVQALDGVKLHPNQLKKVVARDELGGKVEVAA